MNKRYRLNMGESHENITIADDEKRVYLHGYQVELLNEYDSKCKAMETKLEELGFKLLFIGEEYSMSSKTFKNIFTTNPNPNDNGDWHVVTKEEFDKYTKKEKPKEKDSN